MSQRGPILPQKRPSRSLPAAPLFQGELHAAEHAGGATCVGTYQEDRPVGLSYANLDDRTRHFMIQELERDIANGTVYISDRLNEEGVRNWPSVLRLAIEQHDDDWLAGELRRRGYIRTHEQKRKPKGGVTLAKVPVTASDTLAEGEFNRFYARGLCVRALADGAAELEVYRGKQVAQPRLESQAKIGARVEARALLDDLRESQGVEPALGIPPGPNSGLTVRLP